MADEIKICEEKQKEVNYLRGFLGDKEGELQRLRTLVSRRRHCHEYLESSMYLLKFPKNCIEVSDILEQYEELQKANSARRVKLAWLESKISELLSLQDQISTNEIITIEGIDDVQFCIRKLVEHLRQREVRNADVDVDNAHDLNTAIDRIDEIEQLITAYSGAIAEWEGQNEKESQLL